MARLHARPPLKAFPWTRARAFFLAALLAWPVADLWLLSSASPLPDPAADLDLNFGVFGSLSDTQARKAAKTDPAPILAATDRLLPSLTPRPGARVTPVAPYTVLNSTQGIPPASSIFDALATSPLPPLASVLDFLVVSGPLSYAIFTNCSGVAKWTAGSIRPTLNLSFSGGRLHFLDFDQWFPINCDDDTLTGETGSGNDLRVQVRPIIENVTFGFNPTFGGGPPQLDPSLTFLGGLAIEVQRLGDTAAALPLDLAVLKSFSYDQNNYVWFVKFDFPAAPTAFNSSFTSDEVKIEGNLSTVLTDIIGGVSGNISDTNYISELRGPYRLGWNFTGALSELALGAGYARYQSASGTPVLRERTWFDVNLLPGLGETSVPASVLLRLDSESFNTSFDYLEWNADRASRVSLQYFDDRENYTYARATIEDLPTFLQAKVDQVGSGPNATAKIAYLANATIRSIDYDEYVFLNHEEANFIYTHVRLNDLPQALLVNGTLDIGGTVVEPQIRPRAGISLIGELIDRVMIRIASKLYSVGQTLRAIPNNILNLPDQKGWVSIDLPQGGEIGLLEFWLTSGSYAVGAGNFVAFFNDTARGAPPGAVGTSISGRLQHIEHLVAGFIEETTLTLVTSTPMPLTALFLDAPENASAVAEIHDLPSEFTLKISPQSLRYVATGGVSWIAYTSVIGPPPGQYTRLLLTDLPSYMSLNQTPGDLRIDTLFDTSSTHVGIGGFEMQISDGAPVDLPGDHILSFENGTVNAVSARIHDLGSLRYVQGAGGKVRFTAKGGEPFSMAFINLTDPASRLLSFLNFDPLPSTLDVTLPGSLQSVNPISLPSLGSLSSVVDFSHIIFGIDAFGRSVVSMLAQVGSNLANGIGRFDQNFSFSFDSTANTTLTANISKGSWATQDAAQWVHGLRSRQRVSPANNSSLDLNAKLYLTGLPRHMDFALNVEAEVLSVNATLVDFAPAFDYLAIETDSESVDPSAQPKNIRFFTDGILPDTNISLKVDFRSDLSIGGAVIGNMTVSSSVELKDFYVRLTTKRPRPSAVEVLIPEIPREMNTRAEMAEGISISHRASENVSFVLVRLSRGIVGPDASAYAIFHDVPAQVDMNVPAGDPFDMSTANPFKSLPNITLVASSPGLDLVADLNGQALGSRGSLRFIALDLGTRLTMIQSGPSYAISSDGVSRLLLALDGFPISKGLTIDAASIYAEDVRTVTLSHQLVFNAFPILSVDNLNAGKMQIKFEHRINALSGTSKPTNFVFVTVPLGGGGPVSVTSNGLVTTREASGRYLIVPAPALSYLMSQF